MLMLEVLARALVEKLETWPGVHPDHYKGLKSHLADLSEQRVAYADAIARAAELHALGSGDDIEIDEDPVLSIADEGVWVSAWVWVATPAGEDDDEQG